MTLLLTLLGVLVFVVGLLFSIAWHELGHLSTAKLFGIRVPQYMVGFGRTIWSRKKGDTEYGIKAIPMGGYIRMIGMFPPGEDGKVTARSTSPFRSMIEDARSAAYEELQPGDESRLFYTRKPWKRVIVMFAGPFMNLVLALAIFFGVWMTFGISRNTNEIAGVTPCVIQQSEKREECKAGDPVAPAKKAGLRANDRIVAVGGKKVADWTALQKQIRDTVGSTTVTIVRDGGRIEVPVDLVENRVAKSDGRGGYVKGEYVTAGWLGFSPKTEIAALTFGESVDHMGEIVEGSVQSLVNLPAKIPALWNAAFSGAEREPDSPMGIVGAARISGDIAALDLPSEQRMSILLNVLGMFNLSLFLFNMLPLLPLDGGHIAGALWESLRRHVARIFRRADPGPFDVAKLMPAAYVVAGVFVCFTLLVLVADVVNPIKIT
ncbi:MULTISPECIES: RIP metalloprotease [unclassified Streptomyces]|uniref:M50 family metallopeptidase n=1 Tax=unclassified Streptomyces TaxID=2593676 RepID=UPI00224C95C2|nr:MULTISPECIES: site-2 protease family protein [unclassified Streptomyces]MCX4528428.1 site-2 protease family protein [Streptomyces sp. NBC_01551]MCX4540973.1 site-2 protease family protein [Streptomyces sp. NBC_01565]